jgi:unsaturated rhamnogalacturonyl hydrolase
MIKAKSPLPASRRLGAGTLLLTAALTAAVLAQNTTPSATPPASGNSTASPQPETTPAPANLTAYFSNWPADADPKTVGTNVAENVAARKFRYETSTRGGYVIYPEVIAWYGALTFAHLTKNDALQATLIKKFDVFLTPDGATHINRAQHVDFHVFGAVPLEIYIETKDKKYLPLGQSFADDQISSVFLPDGSYSKEARYWVDDLYMLPIVELQAYRATGDKKYLDHTAQLFTSYIDKLQQPTGLFFHGTDAPYYWGRGNGWVAAGFAELLRDLPATDPKRAHLMDGYKKMMAGLLKYQGKDGLWKQLIDHPEAWSETSGSAMFAFAMVTGVKNGWLDAPTYGPAARAAWLGLVTKLDKDNNILDVCGGTNKWPPTMRGNAPVPEPIPYYLTRPNDNNILTTADELHGMAPVLWTATALLR